MTCPTLSSSPPQTSLRGHRSPEASNGNSYAKMSTQKNFSLLVVASYVLDWIIIIAAAGLGGLLSIVTPFKRPFSLYDQDISFPYVVHEKISTVTLVVISFAVPAVVIVAVCLIFVPGPSGKSPSRLVWRRKLWEWYTGWTGLALSCAFSFLITGGMKNLFGRPRPHLLSLCEPDFANAFNFAVGALAPGNVTLRVSQTICRNTDRKLMDDAFRSFPSGHSSFSAAGLLYLSLFLASKLSITIPFHTPQALARTYKLIQEESSTTQTRYEDPDSLRARSPAKTALETAPYANSSGHDDVEIAARDAAASPPLYLLIFAVAPIFAAIYIAATRFTDFRHHAFDILFGQFIGLITAWFSFRLYHLPIRQGAGWSWGPRSKDRAFWSGVGKGVYRSRQEEVEVEVESERKNGYAQVGRGGNGTSAIDLEAGHSEGNGLSSFGSTAALRREGANNIPANSTDGMLDDDIELQALRTRLGDSPYMR